MDRNRKILISILALMVFTALIAILNISMNIQDEKGVVFPMGKPQFGPGVGIVRIEGTIGFSGRNNALGITRGSEAVINRLTELENNSSIKAIVVRINSPGGTVGATQEIFQKLMKLRKKNIPLIASMGEIAASGGYYVASACNVIVANQGTITGSIGVIAAAPNLKGLFEKFGVKMNVIKSGKYKDIFSSHRDMRDDERALLQELIDISYEKFLKDVALGRNMNQSDIKPYADGRVMTGERALEYKLIDKIGTFEDAIDHARELAELSANAPVYEEKKSPMDELFMNLSSMFKSSAGIDEHLRLNDIYRIEYRFVP